MLRSLSLHIPFLFPWLERPNDPFRGVFITLKNIVEVRLDIERFYRCYCRILLFNIAKHQLPAKSWRFFRRKLSGTHQDLPTNLVDLALVFHLSKNLYIMALWRFRGSSREFGALKGKEGIQRILEWENVKRHFVSFYLL